MEEIQIKQCGHRTIITNNYSIFEIIIPEEVKINPGEIHYAITKYIKEKDETKIEQKLFIK
jgi:hypothetical protein